MLNHSSEAGSLREVVASPDSVGRVGYAVTPYSSTARVAWRGSHGACRFARLWRPAQAESTNSKIVVMGNTKSSLPVLLSADDHPAVAAAAAAHTTA